MGQRLPEREGGVGPALIIVVTAWRIEIGEAAGAVQADAGRFIAVAVVPAGAAVVAPALGLEALPAEHIVDAVDRVEALWDGCMAPDGAGDWVARWWGRWGVLGW